MCCEERNTDSRGLPAAACTSARRTRRLRRSVMDFFVAISDHPLLLLAFLAEDELAGIFHALALVGLRRTVAADLRGHLADLLLVDARNDDLGGLRRRHLDVVRDGVVDIVAVAERQAEILALCGRAIADAADLKALLESVGDARHDVLHQRPRHAPHGPRRLR